MEPKKAPREMTGAELNSMLKSSINFKSLGGMRCEELNLTEEDMQWWRDAKIGMFVHWGLYYTRKLYSKLYIFKICLEYMTWHQTP